MYFQLGSYRLGQHNNAVLVGSQILSNYYDTEIRFYSKSGGVKKGFFYGQNNCPIKTIRFEENKHYLGAGDIQFHYINFPIEIDDKVEIYYNGVKKWQGLVDNQITKDGKVDLVPFSEQLSDRIYNSTHISEQIETTLNQIIEGSSSIDVMWGAEIDTGDINTYNWSFKYKPSKDCINDLIKKLNHREWAVDLTNQFVVYEKSTTIAKIIQNTNDNWYSKLKRKVDTKRIKATRHEVVQKSTVSGKIEYVGNVGYDLPGNDFSILEIEKVRRRKDTLFEVSFHSTNSTFLKSYAYSNLESMTELGETIQLTDWRIDKYDPSINTYIKVIDNTEKQLKTIVNCDSVTNWDGNGSPVAYTDDYIEGSGCIQAIGSNPDNSEIYYDFGEIKRYKKLEQINFSIKSDEDVGEVYQFGLSENSSTLWDNPYSIFMNDTDIWEEKYIIPTEQSFRYMGFRLKSDRDTKRQFNWLGRNMLGAYAQPSLYTEYYVDRIQTFGFNFNEYEGLVVQKKYKIDKEGIKVDIILNDYDTQSNQMYFDLSEKAEKLKDVQM